MQDYPQPGLKGLWNKDGRKITIWDDESRRIIALVFLINSILFNCLTKQWMI